MDNEYKKLKEKAVSNLSGTNAEEILVLSCVTLLATSLLSLCQKCLFKITKTTRDKNQLVSWGVNILETTVVVLPILLTSTILSDYLKYIIPIALALLVLFKMIFGVSKENFKMGMNVKSSSHLQFLTNYRSHLLLDTTVSILAVDFQVYPRGLAKTELYGWGYMDAGVGAFIITAGLFAKEAREDLKIKTSTKAIMKKEILSSLPILMIGIARAFLVEIMNYQKHISEYGSHWNFFLTMGFTRIIGAIVVKFLTAQSAGLFSIILLMIYQLCLNNGLTDYILNPNRENIINANKEGLISLIGYLCLYLLGISLGSVIHKRMKGCNTWQWKNQILLILLGLSSHLLMYVAHKYIQPVSRRSVNLGYALWMISLSSFHLAFHSISYDLTGNNSKLFRAINLNGLFYFLLANILTGLINVSVNTLIIGDNGAIFILYLYLLTLGLTVLYLFDHDTCLKIPFFKNKSK